MGMSTHIVGFREADDRWNKMKAVWEACTAIGSQIPKIVLDFFDGEYPGDNPGKEIDITMAFITWGDESSEGFELDITKLPKDLTKVRFYNAY